MINKKTTEYVLNKLIKHRRFNFFGFGTFFVKPARKGISVTKHGVSITKYKWRVHFKLSNLFKQKLNDGIEDFDKL